ncbi:hypothetical protein F5X96DRAFT_667373 [Biscogniauxia mediterranea]|nr:hypothetical protein F5X96DRAFT_667373 [Biscogniauxia mediterranea]
MTLFDGHHYSSNIVACSPPFGIITIAMESSKAPAKKTWSDVASQAPSKGNKKVALNKSGARVTLKASRPAAEPKSTAARTSSSTKSASRTNPTNKEAELPLPSMSSKDDWPALTWPEKISKKPTYDRNHAHVASGEAIYAQETKKLRNNGRSHAAGNGLVATVDASYGKETLATKCPETDQGNTGNASRKHGLHNAVKVAVPRAAVPKAAVPKVAVPKEATRTGVDGPKATRTYRPVTLSTTTIIPAIPVALMKKKPPSHVVPSTHASTHTTTHAHAGPANWLTKAPQHFEDLSNQALRSRIDRDRIVLRDLAARAQARRSQRAAELDHHGAHYMNEAIPIDPFMQRFQLREPEIIMDRYNSDLGPNGYERVVYPEKGWSSSRTWTSNIEKERIRYERIQADLYRSGTENSPCLPRTFQAFLKHQAEVAAAKKLAKEEEMRQLEIDMERLRRSARYGQPLEQLNVPVQISPKLVSISEQDALSLVGGRLSLWTKWYLDLKRVDWPTRQEFRLNGDELAKERRVRRFPLPRLQILDPQCQRSLNSTPTPIPKVGPSVPHEYRVVDDFTITSIKYDGLSHYEAAFLDDPTCEVDMDNLPAATRSFIESII